MRILWTVSKCAYAEKKVLANLEDERSLSRELPVQRVVPDGASPGDRSVRVRRVKPPESGGGEPAGRNTSEPIRASI